MRYLIRPMARGLVIMVLVTAPVPMALAAPADDDRTLTLGFFPLVSTVALFKRFMPLRDYLAEQLARPVVLKTARDFPTFAQRTAERRYDIVVTAPHFAIRAVDGGTYQIRATLLKDVQQLIVVHRDSAIQQISELAGAPVATPPVRALMTMMGKDYLLQNGLSGERSPNYHAFVSHNAANEAVIAGQAVAAIASTNVISKALERGAPLRILSRGLKLPNMATMVATDLPLELKDRIEQALVNMHDTPHGQDVLKLIGFPGYRAVTVDDYQSVRPYAYPSGDDAKQVGR